MLTLQLLAGLALPAQVAVGKWTLDEITKGITKPDQLLAPVSAVLITITVARLLAAAATHQSEILGEVVSHATQEKVLEKAASFGLDRFEDPIFYDKLGRAQREASMRPMITVMSLTRAISTLIVVIAFLAYLYSLHPTLLPILVIAYIPLWLAVTSGGQAIYMLQWGMTPRQRQMSYLSELLTRVDAAKEVRALSIATYLLNRYREMARLQIDSVRKTVLRRLKRTIGASILSAALTAASLLYILFLHTSGSLSLNNTIAALVAFLIMSQQLIPLMSLFGDLHRSTLFLRDYWSFLSEPTGSQDVRDDPALEMTSAPPFEGIRVENVSFRYSGSSNLAINNVSLELKPRETVALVGENGAGKTTLAKLITGLYRPENGSILWANRDYQAYDPDSLQKQIGIIFQDFVHYQFSARENIELGDVTSLGDERRLKDAAKKAGAEEIILRLRDGYDTHLGMVLQAGSELSVGQWQRIALARMFFRDAPVLIMDEPTASLDARSEWELFSTLRSLFADRTVLLISHRFSTVRMADRIYVLRAGQVLEQGSHTELMENNGLYAELFNLQAASYSEP